MNTFEIPELVSAFDKSGKKRNKTVFGVGKTEFGRDFPVIAGPCSVESREQIFAAARVVSEAGASLLRGGAFKPRTSPYSFRGLGREGLALLSEAGREYGLPVVTEAVDTRDVELIARYADVIQIGSRSMHNYPLLEEAGKTGLPVLIKRGMDATVEEWLCCAEYVLRTGNGKVILCERGIRTFETVTRNTLDLSAVAAVKELTHLPVIVDPSHATGQRSLVRPMALAAVMAGCDGLEIEVHPEPECALSDSAQQLSPGEFSGLCSDIRAAVRLRGSF